MKYKLTKAEQETVINFDNELDNASSGNCENSIRSSLLWSIGSMGRSLIRFRNTASVSDRFTVKSVGNSSDRKQRKTDCRLWRREK